MNWWTQANFLYEPDWKIKMSYQAFYLGWACTLLWVPRISDIYGRRKVLITGLTLSAIFYTALLFVSSLNQLIILMFCLGMMRTINRSIGFVYMIELMPKQRWTLVTTIFLVMDVSIYLSGTIYFWFISASYFYFLLIGYLL